MQTQPIQAILFDAVGTLMYAEPDVAEAYWSAGQRFGSRLTYEDVGRRFRVAFARVEAADARDGTGRTNERRERERWADIVREVFDDVAEQVGLLDALWEHFALAAHWRLFDDVAACWSSLQQRGLTLGVASNFDQRLRGIWRELHGGDETLVFASSLVGYRKPHLAFFGEIERALGLPPERLLLVGDDVTNDVRAGRAAGWQVVWIDREASDRDIGVPRIKTLSELGPWLDGKRGRDAGGG